MREVVYDPIAKTEIFSIPGDRIYSGDLSLHHHPIGAALAKLQPFRVTGTLWLNDTRVSGLPDGLSIEGSLVAMGSPYLHGIPNALHVGMNADFRASGIRHLGENISIGGSLFLEETFVTALPQSLKVGGDVVLPDGRRMKVDEARWELARIHHRPELRFFSPDEKSWVRLSVTPAITRHLSKSINAAKSVDGTWLEINPKFMPAQWEGVCSGPVQWVVHADGRIGLRSTADSRNPDAPRPRTATVKLSALVPILEERSDVVITSSGAHRAIPPDGQQPGPGYPDLFNESSPTS